MPPDMIILHYTGMKSAEAALDWLTRSESRVSSHYLLDRDGRISQMVAESERAWHAGLSHWAGRDDINDCSIGIEIDNPGHDLGYVGFPEAQMATLEALCLDIMARRGIARHRVLAHSDVSPGRKIDPGEKFDWARLARSGIGLWVEPEPLGDDAGIGAGETGSTVSELQEQLRALGYKLEITGTYDAATENVVDAFQRHFRPARVDGRADRSVRRTLRRLLQDAEVNA